MEITEKRKYEQLKIYVNGHLHFYLKLLDLISFQSWIHGECEYFIEFYFSIGNKVTLTYGNKEMWEKILKILDKNIS